MRIRYAHLALADLAHIHAHIAEHNPSAARAIIRRIRHAITRLGVFPESGRPGVFAGTRELVVVGTPYIVVYVLGDDHVEVVAVFHGAQDRG